MDTIMEQPACNECRPTSKAKYKVVTPKAFR